jgi:LacI family transcriptional regulator
MENGALLVICNSYRDPVREREYVQLLSAQRVTAIVLAGSGYHDAEATQQLDEALRQYESGGGRVAVIGRHELTGHAVQPANLDGARLAGEYLYALGHRAIGVLAGPKELTTTTDRLTGLRQAGKAVDVALPTRHIVYTDFTRDSGARAAAKLLAADPKITALLAHNDAIAIGALAAARERGVTVPAELSVVGFDDMPIARDVTPPLTTVRLPLVEMGARALTLALGEHPPGAATVETTPAELVVRGSTAPPRA